MTTGPGRVHGEQRATVDLSPEEVYAILAHPYRRYVIAYLHQQRRPIALDDLIAKVAAWDQGTAVSEVDTGVREQIGLALYHTHLPKLADADLLEYRRRPDGDEVELTANIEPLKPSLRAELDEEFQEFYTT